jgi:hypothetical protein
MTVMTAAAHVSTASGRLFSWSRGEEPYQRRDHDRPRHDFDGENVRAGNGKTVTKPHSKSDTKEDIPSLTDIDPEALPKDENVPSHHHGTIDGLLA